MVYMVSHLPSTKTPVKRGRINLPYQHTYGSVMGFFVNGGHKPTNITWGHHPAEVTPTAFPEDKGYPPVN